jgi:hypothetical protein
MTTFTYKAAPAAAPAEPSLEQRYREAEAKLIAHVERMKKRETEFADPREIAQLQKEHWENLNTWSGLKDEVEKCRKS